MMVSQIFSHSHAVAKYIGEIVLGCVDESIRRKQVEGHLKEFVSISVMDVMQQELQAVASDPEFRGIRGMFEQLTSDVINGGKDSLMPQSAERQSVEIEDKFAELAESNIAKNSMKLSRTQKNHIHSINRNKASKVSEISTNSAKKGRMKKQSIFVSLQPEEDDDPKATSYRTQKQAQLYKQQQYRQKERERKSSLAQLRDQFKKQYSIAGCTFDFQGKLLNSAFEDAKINYRAIKIKMNHIDRKSGSSIPPQNQQIHKSCTSAATTNRDAKLHSKDNPIVNLTPKIPVFQSQKRVMVPGDKETCKLNQFKKHYGNKYLRLQRNSKTLEISLTDDREDQLVSKKCSRGEASVNASITSSRSRQSPRRRLALPKIKGKYSTLDRYDS